MIFFFVAKDVCDVLEYSEVSNTLLKLDEDEKGTKNIRTLGGTQSMSVVTEPGLFKLIFRSNKPIAKEFTRWVTHEVLPSIRKTGSYKGSFTQGTLPTGDDEPIEAEVFYDTQGQEIPDPSKHRYRLPEIITPSWVKTVVDLYGKRVAGNYFAAHLGVPQEALSLPRVEFTEVNHEVQEFINECIIKSVKEKTSTQAVYEAYLIWGGSMSKNNFGKELKIAIGIESKVYNINGQSTRFYDGLTLRTDTVTVD